MTPLNLCLNEQLSIAEISYLDKAIAAQTDFINTEGPRLYGIQDLGNFTSSFILKQMINENEINK